jgi:molecular chaperone GrpE
MNKQDPAAEQTGDEHQEADFESASADQPSETDTVPFAEALGDDEPAEDVGQENESELLAEARKEVLRAQAELENFRKRARREMEESKQYAELSLISDLLPVLDNLTRALTAAGGEADAAESQAGLIQGVKMVADLLLQTLAQHHCHPIEAMGQPFDPNFHAAISQQPSTDHEPGTVILEVQRGYVLHDRVVRPSQVIISTSAED